MDWSLLEDTDPVSDDEPLLPPSLRERPPIPPPTTAINDAGAEQGILHAAELRGSLTTAQNFLDTLPAPNAQAANRSRLPTPSSSQPRLSQPSSSSLTSDTIPSGFIEEGEGEGEGEGEDPESKRRRLDRTISPEDARREGYYASGQHPSQSDTDALPSDPPEFIGQRLHGHETASSRAKRLLDDSNTTGHGLRSPISTPNLKSRDSVFSLRSAAHNTTFARTGSIGRSGSVRSPSPPKHASVDNLSHQRNAPRFSAGAAGSIRSSGNPFANAPTLPSATERAGYQPYNYPECP
jgi:hypothetical protein